MKRMRELQHQITQGVERRRGQRIEELTGRQRYLSATGQDRAAERTALQLRHLHEIDQAEKGRMLTILRLQALELKRFDLDTSRTALLSNLEQSIANLNEAEKQREIQVNLGNLTKAKAIDLSQEHRAAIMQEANAAIRELEVLKQSHPEFAALIDETLMQLRQLKTELAQSDESTASNTFLGGAKSALRRFQAAGP